MGASDAADQLASLEQRGRSCHADGDHACVINALASAYNLLEHSDRVGRLGPRYVDLMSDSCSALSMRADNARHRSQFEIFRDIIDLHISEIDNQHAPKMAKATRKHGPRTRTERQDDRRHKAHQQQLQEQKERLQEQDRRLGDLVDQLDTRAAGPGPTTPDSEDTVLEDTTPEDPAPEDPDPELLRTQVMEETKRPIILGTLGIVGGSLAFLSGASLMVDGAAWTMCSGKYRRADGVPSDRCFDLAGARDGLSPFTGFDITAKPEDFEGSRGRARRLSARSWVLGSVTTAAGIGAVAWGAVAVKRARERRRSISLAVSWSPRSPREGGLSVGGRF